MRKFWRESVPEARLSGRHDGGASAQASGYPCSVAVASNNRSRGPRCRWSRGRRLLALNEQFVDVAQLGCHPGEASADDCREVLRQRRVLAHLLVQRGARDLQAMHACRQRQQSRRRRARPASRARRPASRARSALRRDPWPKRCSRLARHDQVGAVARLYPASTMMLPRRNLMRSAWRAISVICSGFRPANRDTRNSGATTLSIAMETDLAHALVGGKVLRFAGTVQRGVDAACTADERRGRLYGTSL